MDRDLLQLAGRFLEFVHRATGLPMIVCDETGTIVQAVDRTRLGTQHAGAQRILRGEVDEVFVTDEDAARDPRMKAGCNTVILIDEQRVGTFGLAGPLRVAQPLTRVASAVLASWVSEQRRQRALHGAADRVVAGVREVSQRADDASAEAEAVVQRMTEAAARAREQVEAAAGALRAVQEIAQKSRVLSINGSVEAARAGDQGRGFAVVSREMLDLAEGARATAVQTQADLTRLQRSLSELQEAIDRSAALTREQVAALGQVREVAQSMQAVLAELTR